MTNRPNQSSHLRVASNPDEATQQPVTDKTLRYRRVMALYPRDEETKKPLVPLNESVAAHVEMFLRDFSVGINLRADSYTYKGEGISPEDLAEYIWSEWPYVAQALFRVACKSVVANLRAKVTACIKGRILNAPSVDPADTVALSPLGELHKWLDLVLPDGLRTSDPQLYAYYETTMRQLVWQVKRRMRGERTWWELMPVLIAAQGTGKSSAVEKFGAPLNILFMPDADFTLFEDPFRIKQLERSYLIRLDEMGKASRTDTDLVKRTVTQPLAQSRAMRSQSEIVVSRNASFIGTSNHPLSQLFHDATGMRRFVEIRCRDDRYTEEWGKAIRAIDYLLLWQVESGLDELSPYSANEKLMHSYQQALCIDSDFEMWRAECVKDAPGERLKQGLARENYAEWCQKMRCRTLSSHAFTGLMRTQYSERKYGNRPVWCHIKLRSTEISETDDDTKDIV